jgi:hypothetical protein
VSEHPRQPIDLDPNGVPRFKGNAIIRRLVNENIVNLNTIGLWDVPAEDRDQFWQLLGYSVSGYGELSFISPETVAWADAEAEAVLAARVPPPAPRTSFERLLEDEDPPV